MKAKIIKTGEIVEVYHEPQHGQISNIYKESVFVNGRLWQENELEFIESKEVDLEKLGEIARHLIAVKEHVEDMRLDNNEWLLLEKIGYPERFKTQKGE